MSRTQLGTGETLFSERSTQVEAVIGSCVAFFVFDQRLGYGGACHYALPDANATGHDSSKPRSYYGESAIIDLLRNFKKKGSRPEDLKVKILGGADIVNGISSSIGRANVAIAKEVCKRLNLSIVGISIGGMDSVKFQFTTGNGQLKFKKVVAFENKTSAPAKPQLEVASSPLKSAGPAKPVSVLIVDDSKVIQILLKKIISEDPRFKVFGVAAHPLEAEKLMENGRPDVITLDMQMPHMDGVTYLRKTLQSRGIPVIMISGASNEDGKLALEALELGAIDFISKPAAEKMQEFGPVIRDKVLAASTVSRKHIKGCGLQASAGRLRNTMLDPKRILVIGSSTGGTTALTEIFKRFPDQIPPTLVVQHIPPVFSKLFADRLNTIVNFSVKEAADGDRVLANQVLIAPGNTQMKLVKSGDGLVVRVNDDEPVHRHKPSVDYLFSSVAKIVSERTVGCVLTGMGKDGAQGLLELKNTGALTCAQDEESCVVFGMPKEAIALNAANNVVSLSNMAEHLIKEASQKVLKISA